MLETPQERVELLKAGINSSTIEKLYLAYNNFRIINIPLLFEHGEFDNQMKSISSVDKVHNHSNGKMHLTEYLPENVGEDCTAPGKMIRYHSPLFLM